MSKYIVVHGIRIAKDFVPETFGNLTTIGPRFLVPHGKSTKYMQVCCTSDGKYVVRDGAKEYHRERYLRVKDAYKVRFKDARSRYYDENKSQYKERYSAKRDKVEFRLHSLYASAKVRCRHSGLEFSIAKDFLPCLYSKQNGTCALTGIPFDLTIPESTKKNPFGPSIDRIDSKQGYTPKNTRLVCCIVNFALNEFGVAAFDKMCQARLSLLYESGIQT